MKVSELQLRSIIRRSLLNEKKLDFSGVGGSRSSGDSEEKQEGLAGEEWIPKEGSKGKMLGKSIDGPEGLDDYALPFIEKFFNSLLDKGYNIYVTSVFRTRAKQASLTSKVKANIGTSPHQYGIGIDVNINWVGKDDKKYDLKMASSNKDWQKVIENNTSGVDYKDYKLRWGGTFKKRDAVHFDVTHHPEFKSIRSNDSLAGRSLGSKLKDASDKVADGEAIMWTDLKKKWSAVKST